MFLSIWKSVNKSSLHMLKMNFRLRGSLILHRKLRRVAIDLLLMMPLLKLP